MKLRISDWYNCCLLKYQFPSILQNIEYSFCKIHLFNCLYILLINFVNIQNKNYIYIPVLYIGHFLIHSFLSLYSPGKRDSKDESHHEHTKPLPEVEPASDPDKDQEDAKVVDMPKVTRACFNMVCYGMPNLIVTQQIIVQSDVAQI